MRDCQRITHFVHKGILFTILFLNLCPVVLIAQEDVAPAAQPAGDAPQKADEAEEVVDLDALEEVAAAGAPKSLIRDEPLLPVSMTELEIPKQPMLKLAALALLVPVAAMLYRPKRKKKPPKRVVRTRSDDGKER